MPHTLYLISGVVKSAAVARLRFARRWKRGTRRRLSAIHPKTSRNSTRNSSAVVEKEKHKEGFAFQQQAPFRILIPFGENAVQLVVAIRSGEWQCRQPHVRHALVAVFGVIMGQSAGRLAKNPGILQIFLRQQISLSSFKKTR